MKTKKLFFSLALVLNAGFATMAQSKIGSTSGFLPDVDYSPTPCIRWTYSANKTSQTEAILTLSVVMNRGWRIYAQKGNKDGPVNTSFTFQPSSDYELVDSLVAPMPMIRDDKFFLFKVSCYEDTAVFKQKIKLHKDQTVVKGRIEYMGEASNVCLPVKNLSFSIKVK